MGNVFILIFLGSVHILPTIRVGSNKLVQNQTIFSEVCFKKCSLQQKNGFYVKKNLMVLHEDTVGLSITLLLFISIKLLILLQALIVFILF